MPIAENSGTKEINLLSASMGNGNLTVGDQDVIYSYSMVVPRNMSMGLKYQLTSPGTVSVKIEIEHGDSAPGTEGAADTDFVIGEGVTTLVADETDELVHYIAISPVVCRRIRFKFTGGAGNNSATAFSQLAVQLSENQS